MSMSMTIDQYRDRKRNVEREIRDALDRFIADTGIGVRRITVTSLNAQRFSDPAPRWLIDEVAIETEQL